MSTLPPDILAQQIAYYRARASEDDEWFLRTGRYDQGSVWNVQWFREVSDLDAILTSFHPAGDVLELACGTGWWTERLARTATTLTAVDVAPEVVTFNRRRLAPRPVTYLQADLFTWEPPQRYDVVFFSFSMGDGNKLLGKCAKSNDTSVQSQSRSSSVDRDRVTYLVH